jgi:hypothetical protein
MQPEQLDALYATLAEAIDRVGDDKVALLLATLSLDLIAHHADFDAAADAIARAERLAGI